MARQPNIVVIWGDDVGWFNPSCYHRGIMGYRTPSIDRIASEGALFTDWYGQQSCTAGRAAFVTGQSPIRTGLTKVGLPGARLGLQPEDPTIAELLKPLAYATGQFGKHHLGDRNEFLPTNHGFDEFFGSLYHLNAEEEPESPDYPKDANFRKRIESRGVLHCWSNQNGTQKIDDTGPLTSKRMKTVDDESLEAALHFIDRAHEGKQPFFLWFNSTGVHVIKHLEKQSLGVTGLGVYPEGLVEHDAQVGRLLAKLDELGITKDTIVIYSTDSGAEVFSWPDGGGTPFRGEKDTSYEGGWRVPCVMRWPGVIEPGAVSNEMFSHTDLLPTLLAAAGDPDIVDKLKKGHRAGKKSFRVHIDGYSLLPFLSGKTRDNPRQVFFYWSDDGDLVAMRFGIYKFHFMERRGHETGVPFSTLRTPKLFNLRRDPFERGDRDAPMYYERWFAERGLFLVPAQALVAQYLKTFEEFPPRQRPASFDIDQALERAWEKQKALAVATPDDHEAEAPAAPSERPAIH